MCEDLTPASHWVWECCSPALLQVCSILSVTSGPPGGTDTTEVLTFECVLILHFIQIWKNPFPNI